MGEGLGVTSVRIADPQDARATDHTVLGLHADVHSLVRLRGSVYAGTTEGVYVLSDDGNGRLTNRGLVRTSGAVRALSAYDPRGSTALLFISDDRAGVLIAEVSESDIRARYIVSGGEGAVVGSAFVDRLAVLPLRTELRLISLDDPARPAVESSLDVTGTVAGVAPGPIGSALAYVSTDGGDGAAEILALDVSNPHRPRIASRSTGAPAGRLTNIGRALLVVSDGVHVVEIDADDPARLSYAGVYSRLPGTVAVAIHDATILAARADCLTVGRVDLDEPLREPQLQSTVHSLSPVLDAAVLGPDHIYVAEGERGLDVVELGKEGSGTHVEANIVASYRPPGGVYGVRAGDARAYLSTRRGFEMWNTAAPGDPVPGGAAVFAEWPPTRWIDVTDRWVAASTSDRLFIAEIADGQLPVPIGELEYGAEPGWPAEAVPRGLALSTDSTTAAYIAAGHAGLVVVDLSDPSRPTRHSVIPFPASQCEMALSVAISERYLAVGGDCGVAVYDVSDPLRPELVGLEAASPTYSARGLAFAGSGERLYVAADVDGGLIGLDLSSVAAPQRTFRLGPTYPIRDVRAGFGRIYTSGAGLMILEEEASGPTEPTGIPSPTRPPALPTAAPRPFRYYLPVLWIWRSQ